MSCSADVLMSFKHCRSVGSSATSHAQQQTQATLQQIKPTGYALLYQIIRTHSTVCRSKEFVQCPGPNRCVGHGDSSFCPLCINMLLQQHQLLLCSTTTSNISGSQQKLPGRVAPVLLQITSHVPAWKCSALTARYSSHCCCVAIPVVSAEVASHTPWQGM